MSGESHATDQIYRFFVAGAAVCSGSPGRACDHRICRQLLRHLVRALEKGRSSLTRGGFLRGIRGRSGGFELAQVPDQINLGAVLRLTEPDFGLFECYLTGNTCTISRPCRLPSVATEALVAFLSVFDRHTLADVLVRPDYFLPQQVKQKQPIRGPKLATA